MSLVPASRPGAGVDAPKGAPGGRYRSMLPRHSGPRRLRPGTIIGIVAAVLVVVLVLVVGGVFFWQSKLHADAVGAYQAALTDWRGAQDASTTAERTLETANASLATLRDDANAIVAAAADGFVAAEAKAAVTSAVAAIQVETPSDDTAATAAATTGAEPSDSPAPDPSATPTPPDAPAVIDDPSSASIDELQAAAATLTAAAATTRDAATAVSDQATAATATRQDLETKVEALLASGAQQGRTWLAAFVGKDAPAGQKLDAALGALEQATAETPDRAGLLGAYITWAGPAVPGALSDPNSIYVVVDKLHPINDFDEQNPGARQWAPGDLISVGNGQRMRQVAGDALKQLIAAAKAAGYSVPALSCYRSWASQNATYAHWVAVDGSTSMADSHSARPGYSEHQTGLVCDIGAGSQAWGGTAAGKWTAANAANYGFILRYDEGKQDQSGYVYEPWHFRYVGVATAQAIYAAGNPTLEQWMGLKDPKTYSDGSGSPDANAWGG